ncbi:60s ribosome biogenesis protein mak11 [Coemansia biformis]|uniref:60s ribosome biogenesis protein mak11 n=1 Tax=Coemansia biformis TaxID=1286918 RepID=A0A9W7YFQ7_9FUNG|nr:60s ribosome biogenesis protein mak11 [Coemansia biformis]
MAGNKRKRPSPAKAPAAAEAGGLPPLAEREPARESFLIAAGTYERILYGIEARFAGDQLTLSPQFIFPSHIGCIKAVAAGGRYLASGSTDEIVKVYDLKKRVELGSLHEHKGSITALQFHGHTHLLSASEDGTICVFRTKDWEPLKILKGHRSSVSSIAIHPSGKLALSVARDRTIVLWNLLTGQRASRTKTPQVGELVAWSPSGTRYVVAYATEIQVYGVSQAEALATIFARQRILAVLVVAHGDAEYVLCGCQDKRIHMYSTAGAELASFHCHENRIKGLCSVDMLFPDGSTHTVVVSISSDGRIKAWDLAEMLARACRDAEPAQPGAEPAQPDCDLPGLQIEPLAVYDADARLTCVSVSSNGF